MKTFEPSLNMFYLIRLIGRGYFKNYGALFTDFGLPIIIVTILFGLLENINMNTVGFMIPGALLTPITSCCFVSFAVGVNEWRKSVIIKKIRVSRINVTDFFAAFVFFFMLISALSFCFILGYTVFLEQVGLKALKGTTDHLKKINWGWALLSILLLMCITIFLGLVFAFSTNKTQVVLASTLTLFIVQAFMLGNYLPLNMVLQKKMMKFVSYFLPFYAPTRMFQVVWLNKLSIGNSDAPWANELFIKDWEVMKNFVIWEDDGSDIKRTLASFHKSYWSLILLSLGWIVMSGSFSIYFMKNKKFS